jgi:hypothetical protein
MPASADDRQTESVAEAVAGLPRQFRLRVRMIKLFRKPGCFMKIRSFASVLAGCVALGAFHSGFAQETISGTIGGGTPSAELIRANVNHVALNISGLLKFKFQAVTSDGKAGVPYVMNFCIGPAKNPCGLSTDIVCSPPV